MIYLERIKQEKRASEFIRALDGTIVDRGPTYTDMTFICACGARHYVTYRGKAPDKLWCSVCGHCSTWEEMVSNLAFAKGIGVDGVASAIGALGRETFAVERGKLVAGLCYQFGTSVESAESAIKHAIETGVVTEVRDQIILVDGPAE